MSAYYNEYEPYAADWLRNLIKKGLIADGIVDDRSITSVEASDLRDFTQCHFFAGIGVWSYALRLAGWPDDQPVWTGSCPCQPFSAAGKQKGFADERHLWPEFHRLIAECRPPVVFGEQVASKDGLAWLDTVCADLETSGYAVGAVDLCAAGIGAPHIRQRLWFVAQRLADAIRRGRGEQPPEQRADGGGGGGYPDLRGGGVGLADAQGGGGGAGLRDQGPTGQRGHLPADGCGHGGLDDPAGARHLREIEGSEGAARHETRMRLPGEGRGSDGLAHAEHDDRRADEPGRGPEGRAADGRGGPALRMADADDPRLEGRRGVQERSGERAAGPGGLAGGLADADGRDARAEGLQRGGQHGQQPEDGRALQGGWPCPTNGHWGAADWLHCRDGKWRPVEPGTFPLAHGAASRVGRLRAYGNAIVPQVAAEVIAAFMECRP